MRVFIVFIGILIITSTESSGQLMRDLHKLYNPKYSTQSVSDTSTFKPWKRFIPGKTNYSFEVGTGYSSFGSGIGMSSSYVSPSVVFSPTQNLLIEVGGRFSHNSFNGAQMTMPLANGESQMASPGNPTEAYVHGRYIVNNKLSVYGTGAFGNNQVYYSPYNRGFSTTDYQHVSFGMDYKISEKVSIGASFGFTNGPAWGNSYQQNTWNTLMP